MHGAQVRSVSVTVILGAEDGVGHATQRCDRRCCPAFRVIVGQTKLRLIDDDDFDFGKRSLDPTTAKIGRSVVRRRRPPVSRATSVAERLGGSARPRDRGCASVTAGSVAQATLTGS